MFAADHPYVANCQTTLAEIYIAEGKIDEARPLSEDALLSRQKAFPIAHPKVARSLEQVGQVRELQGKNEEALSFYAGSIDTFEKIYGKHAHPDMKSVLQRYTSLLEKSGHSKEAADVRNSFSHGHCQQRFARYYDEVVQRLAAYLAAWWMRCAATSSI